MIGALTPAPRFPRRQLRPRLAVTLFFALHTLNRRVRRDAIATRAVVSATQFIKSRAINRQSTGRAPEFRGFFAATDALDC